MAQRRFGHSQSPWSFLAINSYTWAVVLKCFLWSDLCFSWWTPQCCMCSEMIRDWNFSLLVPRRACFRIPSCWDEKWCSSRTEGAPGAVGHALAVSFSRGEDLPLDSCAVMLAFSTVSKFSSNEKGLSYQKQSIWVPGPISYFCFMHIYVPPHLWWMPPCSLSCNWRRNHGQKRRRWKPEKWNKPDFPV